MINSMSMFSMSPYPLVGFGAGQMVPSVAYHLQSDLSFLEYIYDDHDARDGLHYPYLSPIIKTPEQNFSLENKSVLVTALDHVRPITARLVSSGPQFIYTLGNVS